MHNISKIYCPVLQGQHIWSISWSLATRQANPRNWCFCASGSIWPKHTWTNVPTTDMMQEEKGSFFWEKKNKQTNSTIWELSQNSLRVWACWIEIQFFFLCLQGPLWHSLMFAVITKISFTGLDCWEPCITPKVRWKYYKWCKNIFRCIVKWE